MDISGYELRARSEPLISRGALVYVKWTCLNCRERVTSTKPNIFYLGGWLHEECGEVYRGDQFGMLVVFPLH